MRANRTIEGVVEDEEEDEEDEPIEAEVIDVTPKRCPKCESYDVVRAKKFAVYALFMVAIFGVGVAVDQGAVSFVFIMAAFLAYFVTPPFRCNECGERFD